MGKTYEALEIARKEHKKMVVGTSLDTQQAVAPKTPEQLPARAPLEIYQQIKVKLITRFTDTPIKTILVTSTAYGDGSSTTAVGLAAALARDCKLKVLLVDVNLRAPSLHEVFKIEYDQGLFNILTRRNNEKPSIFRKQTYGDLYVIPSGGSHSGPLTLFESKHFDNFLKSVREQFSYVIMDAPPVNSCAESRVIGPKADGVILVIEAGKTRRQVALQAKQELEDAGANVLGVVLNKRKYYIPEWVYRRL